MAKGFHTAGAAVLFERAPSAASVREALSAFGALHDLPEPEAFTWMGAGGWSLAQPLGGRLVVQIFDRGWPDGMGDPKSDPDQLFGGWALGFFGPFTYPGGLLRSTRQSWTWDGAGDAVGRHRAFVRLLVTYAGAFTDQKVLPAGYSALDELVRVTRVAAALAALDGVVAYSNPGGEVLLPPEALGAALVRDADVPPIDVWSNVRLFRVPEVAPWTLMDTVGLGQLDLTDLEACCDERVSAPDVARFLRDVSLHLLRTGAAVADGDTLDGPGGPWEAWSAEAISDPPRRVLRLFPAAATPPAGLLDGTAKPPPPRPGLWKRWFG